MVSNTHKSSNSSDGESLPQLISAKTLAYIHQLLQERPLLFYFENDIEVRFYAKRAEEYRRLLSVGKMLFLVLYAIIAAIAIVMALADLPFFRHHYQWLATPVSSLILFCVILASLTSYDPLLAQHATYDVMIIVTIISFGLRVQFPVCLLIVCLAAILTVLTTVSLNWNIDWFKFAHFYGLGSFITLIIVALIERQERFAFLQELLVAHQTVELDRLNRALDRISREDH